MNQGDLRGEDLTGEDLMGEDLMGEDLTGVELFFAFSAVDKLHSCFLRPDALAFET